MNFHIREAQSYWDCVDALRHHDRYKAQLIDALLELRRQPFRNPKLRTHHIGHARNGYKLFSSDVGGKASDRRLVWQFHNETVVLLLYGTHKVQDRARRMRIDLDPISQVVQVYEHEPDSGVERNYQDRREEDGKLFMAWSTAELLDEGFPESTVIFLRRLNDVDELFDLGQHLGTGYLDRAFDLVAGERPGSDPVSFAEEPETEGTPLGVAAEPPEVTPEDVELERLLNDERAGASFARNEPEFMAEVIGRPIEDWMIFIHPDQRAAATRRYQGPARVRGAAGTGKTVVGLHRAVELAQRNRLASDESPQQAAESRKQSGESPEQPAESRHRSGGSRERPAESRQQPGDKAAPVLPVLFTTYIKTLPPVFEELHRRIPGARPDHVEFIHVDKLASDICDEAGERAFINATKAKKAFDAAFRQTVVTGTPLHGKFTSRYLQSEITSVIKGRALESLEGYLVLERTGRRAGLGRLQRIQVWELMECWDRHMARHGTLDFSDVILRALCHARQFTEPRYSAVIVDEAQDLTLAGLQLLRALVNAPHHDVDRPDGLFILGDGAQRIYPGGFKLRQAGVEVRGRTTVLTENYRNTSEIIGAAMAVAGESNVEDLAEEFPRGGETVVTLRQGPPPQLVEIDGQDQQIDAIALRIGDLIQSTPGYGLGDMAVLAPSGQLVNKAVNQLQDAGLEAQRLDNYDGRPSDQVKVGTFHRAKGLEFKAVFVLAPNWFATRPRKGAGEEEASEDRDLDISALFVAMTRARDFLVVVHGSRPATEIAAAADHFEVVES